MGSGSGTSSFKGAGAGRVMTSTLTSIATGGTTPFFPSSVFMAPWLGQTGVVTGVGILLNTKTNEGRSVVSSQVQTRNDAKKTERRKERNNNKAKCAKVLEARRDSAAVHAQGSLPFPLHST